MKILFWILSLFALFGCASSPPVLESNTFSRLRNVNAKVEYVRVEQASNSTEELDAEHLSQKVLLIFPLIPGQIFGNPSTKPIFRVVSKKGENLSLDLSMVQSSVETIATTITAQAKSDGLSIYPGDTKFARFGTFALNPVTERSIGGGGFIDSTDRSFLILMYFSKPCDLKGSIRAGKDSYFHDIKIPGKGFHWLRIEQSGTQIYRVSRVEPPENVGFSIILLDAAKT